MIKRLIIYSSLINFFPLDTFLFNFFRYEFKGSWVWGRCLILEEKALLELAALAVARCPYHHALKDRLSLATPLATV